MNKDWAWRPIGRLFEIGAGKTMSAAARNGTDKTPFLRTSNVLWDKIHLSSVDEMWIPVHELSSKLLRLGDLLVCEGGEIGRAAIWCGEVDTMSFQNHLHRLRPLAPNVVPRFYVFFLQSAFTQLAIYEGAGNKTTIPNLSRSRLAGLKVPLPSLAEQHAISCVLGRIRKAIEVQNRSLVEAQALKRTAMNTLFTIGLRGEAQKATEIGLVPENWNLSPLGTLCEATDVVDLRREGDRMIEYVDVSSLSREFLHIESTSRFKLREAPKRARKRMKKGDVIIATVRPTLMRTATVPAELDNHVCSTAFCVLRQNQKRTAEGFIRYVVQREQFVRQLSEIETGASYPAVTDRMVKERTVPVPPLREQGEIVAVLNAIDHKIDLQRRKRAVLEELFNVLLHKLMTEEVGVGELDLSTLPDSATSLKETLKPRKAKA